MHCGSIRNRVRSCGLCFRVRSRARETVTVGRFIPVTCKVRHMILYRSTIEAQHAHKGTLRNQHMRGKTRITRLRRFARFAASAPNPRRRSCCQRAVRARWSAHLSARLIAASRMCRGGQQYAPQPNALSTMLSWPVLSRQSSIRNQCAKRTLPTVFGSHAKDGAHFAPRVLLDFAAEHEFAVRRRRGRRIVVRRDGDERERHRRRQKRVAPRFRRAEHQHVRRVHSTCDWHSCAIESETL